MIPSGRSAGARWAALPMAFVAALSLARPAFLQPTERAAYDRIVRSAPTTAPDGRVAIVDIDEQSLQAVGQWPWRRDVFGQLVEKIRAGGASAIALDILFADPERVDGNTPSSDPAFVKVLSGGRVVLGFAMTFEPGSHAPASCVEHPVNIPIRHQDDEDAEPFFDATGVVCSLPQFAVAAGASGFLNAAPDSDGIVRRVPVLLQLGGRVYPSLALATVAAATGRRPADVNVENLQTVSLMLGDRDVPLDGQSHLLVRYRGVKHTIPYVSAADVMSARTAPGAFANKIVFVGTTALGTREVVATPLDTLFAGVEVQATVADNLLRGDFFRRPHHGAMLETLAVLALAALIVAFARRFGLAWASAATALLVAAAWGGSVALLARYGAFVSPLFPTLGAAGTLATMAAAQLVVERKRADHAVAGGERSQRMMIQALLSLTETRDAETGRHSRRTSHSMRLLAGELSKRPRYRDYLTVERIDLLATLAPIHDIGKVGIADRVLNKPGALTPEELIEMRQHPELGRGVIERAARDVGGHEDAVLALAKDIVYTHHEKWDGTGYPRGLRGEEIPIAGRLMAVVDVYDAAVSRRLYQNPMSHEETVSLISRGRGTHFDPAVVDAFLTVSGEMHAETARAQDDVSEIRRTPAATRGSAASPDGSSASARM